VVDVVNFATLIAVNGSGATFGIAVGATRLIGAGGRLSAPTAGVTIAIVKADATAILIAKDFLLRGMYVIFMAFLSVSIRIFSWSPSQELVKSPGSALQVSVIYAVGTA